MARCPSTHLGDRSGSVRGKLRVLWLVGVLAEWEDGWVVDRWMDKERVCVCVGGRVHG